MFPPERTIAFAHSFCNSSSQLYKASNIIYYTLLLLAPTNPGLFSQILLETDFCRRVFDFRINGDYLAIRQLETLVLDLESVKMLEGSFMDFWHNAQLVFYFLNDGDSRLGAVVNVVGTGIGF